MSYWPKGYFSTHWWTRYWQTYIVQPVQEGWRFTKTLIVNITKELSRDIQR